MRMLQTHAPALFSVVFILMRFRPFSTVHMHLYYMYALLNFDPLSRAFSNRYVFDENAQCIIVDRRRKRIEMYAFLNENALMWTDPQSATLRY